KFITAAKKQGASCVLCQKRPRCAIPYVLVENSRSAEALAAAAFYGHPAESLTMVGVTGTNGKTTTTNLVRTIIEGALGCTCGLIGTNRNIVGGAEEEAARTTPDSIELQCLLRRMADAGDKYCVMEVSSHAICLDRVRGIRFAAAAFTNLTEDHLDFHKTMDAYAQAKSRLFACADVSVINVDDEYAPVMLSAVTGRTFTFSTEKNSASITAKDIRLGERGVSFTVLTDEGIQRVTLGIPGLFSVYNGLCAFSIALCLGIGAEKAAAALATASGVKGRAEVVPTDTPYTVIIDYAHSPDALQNILKTIRGFCRKRIITVFGCGGDRDRDKRPIMGAIAGRMSDYVFVTSDNPRTEEPMSIIEQITAGMKSSRAPYEVIEDRRAAISAALKCAGEGDVVLLAGKGHETYQIIGKEKRHFDEREVVAELLGKEQL
ncbi:MAG: UDP-N-acetylmuramoyl-L-alanyl-D-glutamate--2,6-diaminopimelate ligase, partial [Oscillospiraceae bacterium]|nr:UDP-N-acetylmuramoyl-L-alanyl-D-glutamate--2,6-diaminopimelate ligase [Oscillospiraceae bacterium]